MESSGLPLVSMHTPRALQKKSSCQAAIPSVTIGRTCPCGKGAFKKASPGEAFSLELAVYFSESLLSEEVALLQSVSATLEPSEGRLLC